MCTFLIIHRLLIALFAKKNPVHRNCIMLYCIVFGSKGKEMCFSLNIFITDWWDSHTLWGLEGWWRNCHSPWGSWQPLWGPVSDMSNYLWLLRWATCTCRHAVHVCAHTHTPLHIGPYWQCPFIFTSTMYSVSLPVLGSFCALGLEPSPEQRCWYGAMFDDTECLFMCGLVYPILWKISMCPLLSFVLDCLLLWPRGFLCMVCVLAFP